MRNLATAHPGGDGLMVDLLSTSFRKLGQNEGSIEGTVIFSVRNGCLEYVDQQHYPEDR